MTLNTWNGLPDPKMPAQAGTEQERALYECVACNHLYEVAPSSCDCCENPKNEYREWEAFPKDQAARRAQVVPQGWKQLTEAPRIGASVWTVLLNNEPPVWGSCWSGSDAELENLRKGLVHATHASAMDHAAAPQPPEAEIQSKVCKTEIQTIGCNEVAPVQLPARW